jgi:hypothetical protein
MATVSAQEGQPAAEYVRQRSTPLPKALLPQWGKNLKELNEVDAGSEQDNRGLTCLVSLARCLTVEIARQLPVDLTLAKQGD